MKTTFPKNQIGWVIYFLAITGAGIAAIAALIRIQSDPKGAVLFGFSIQRILLIVFIAVIAGTSLYAAVRAAFRPSWVVNWLIPAFQRLGGLRWVGWICAAAGLLGWLGLFVSPDTLGRYHAYFIRARPVLVYLGFCAALAYIHHSIQIRGWRFTRAAAALKNQRGLLIASAAVMAVLCGLWLVIALTGLGVDADPYFWNEAGAPVLGLQLILSLFIAGAFQLIIFSRDPTERRKGIDWGVTILIWGSALLFWQSTFMPRSYFAPGPYPPNMVYYPYSDAERYDLSAQYLLLGRGIANGEYMDKPAYVFLLAMLHLIAGQDFNLLVGLQVALFALTPVGLYFLGKALHSRSAGLIIALLATFQQRNAIAATLEIPVSHSKLLLTEYPAALLLIFFCLFAVRWFQAPERRTGDLLISGGLLGIAALVRPNALFLAPLMIILVLFRSGRPRKAGVAASAWFTLVFVLTLLPWNLSIPRGFDTPYLIAKARSLLDTRYKIPEIDTSYAAPAAGRSETPPPSPATSSAHFAAPEDLDINLLKNEQGSYSFIIRHFFHNEIMAFFILPHNIILEDLNRTLQTPYWQNVDAWRGELPAGSIFLVILNLGILSVGIGSAWKRWQLAGLIPIFMQMGYYFANAVVRNSGGRYLVPVDWVLLLYYALGIIKSGEWLRTFLTCQPYETRPAGIRKSESKNDIVKLPGWPRRMMIAGCFLFVGALLPLSKYLFPDQLPSAKPEQILMELDTPEWQDERLADWLRSIDQSKLLNEPNVVIIKGRGYYPRFYDYGQGESDGELAVSMLPAGPEPHFTLRVLTRDWAYIAVLPTSTPPPAVPDSVETVVVGCAYGDSGHIDTAVILLGGGEVLWRQTNAALTCQLPLPDGLAVPGD